MTLALPHNRVAAAVCLFALSVILFVLLRPLLPIDETRYLTVAWEMWQGGSRAVPRLNGEIYSDKPPLLFWLINMVWVVTGTSEIAARLVAPAFGVVSVILTARLARALWPETPERAGLSALVLASGGVFLFYGSATMFDTLLTTAVLAAMLALLAMRRAAGIMPVFGLGAALAFGVLAKGPVILVHVLPAALLMPVWADRPTRPAIGQWYRGIGLAILVALALVLIWLGPALLLGGQDYRTDVLWRQSAGRMVASFAHDRPWWFFPALLPLFVWPWGWSRHALATLAPRRVLADEGARLVALWAVSALAGFSLISGKQVHYLLPELPAMALLLSAMAAGDMTAGDRPKAGRLLLLVPALLVAGLAVAIFTGAVPQAQVNGARLSALGLGLTLAVAAALAALVLRRNSVILATAGIAPATLLMLHLALIPMIRAGYDPKVIADVLRARPGSAVATTDRSYAGQFSFAARLDRPVSVLDTPEALAVWARQNPAGTLIARQGLEGPGPELLIRRSFQGKDYLLYRMAGGKP